MKLVRGLIAALATYSRIPMPRIELSKDDMKHCLVFLSFVGVIIGGFEVLIFKLCKLTEIPDLVLAIILALVPIVITGGFHIDGLMDVLDAKSSYKSIEEKLMILSDPHIGAFSVIGLLKYGLFFMAGLLIIAIRGDKSDIYSFALSFTLSRAICALTALHFKPAKDKGMLKTEKEGALYLDSVLVAGIMVIVTGLMCYVNLISAAFILLMQLILALYYKKSCYLEFGGVSGDTCGYLICMSELITTLAIAGAIIIR